MRFAVDLNRQATFQAGEVQAVTVDRMLAPELVAAGSGTESTPEENFGKVAAAAFATRESYGFGLGRADPSTALRAVPLPVPGRY